MAIFIRGVLNYLGDLSYPLYLIHFPALIAAVGFGMTASTAAMGFAIALSIVALYVVDARLKPTVLAMTEWSVVRALLRKKRKLLDDPVELL